MKKLIVSWTLLLVCGFASSGQASLVTFSETFLGDVGDSQRLSIANQTYLFKFDLTTTGKSTNFYRLNTGGSKTAPTEDASGYTPGAYTITSAVLYYTLYDTDSQLDAALIKTRAADGGLTVGDYRGANKLDLNSSSPLRTFSYSFDTADLSWLEDGILTLTIKSANSIELDQLRLEVQADAQPVPLPSVAWLLGPSLLGMVAIRRKTQGAKGDCPPLA